MTKLISNREGEGKLREAKCLQHHQLSSTQPANPNWSNLKTKSQLLCETQTSEQKAEIDHFASISTPFPSQISPSLQVVIIPHLCPLIHWFFELLLVAKSIWPHLNLLSAELNDFGKTWKIRLQIELLIRPRIGNEKKFRIQSAY